MAAGQVAEFIRHPVPREAAQLEITLRAGGIPAARKNTAALSVVGLLVLDPNAIRMSGRRGPGHRQLPLATRCGVEQGWIRRPTSFGR